MQDLIFHFLLFVLLLVFLCSFQGAVRVGPSNDVHTLSAHFHEHGGDKGSRTPDLLLARQALSQLSYAPIFVLQGAGPGPED